MNKTALLTSDVKIASVDDVSKWHQLEERVLLEKLTDAKAKPPTIEEKLDTWRGLSEGQRRRKCITRLKGKFRKPERLLSKLQEIGEDVIAAVEEGVKPYRIERIIANYAKQRLKLLEMVKEVTDLVDELPEVSSAVGGFDWKMEVPEVIDADGILNIMVKGGAIRRAEVETED